MKRYALFLFESHEEQGGWRDFAGAFDTTEAAFSLLTETAKPTRWRDGDDRRYVQGIWTIDEVRGNYWHLVDLETMEIVFNNSFDDPFAFLNDEFIRGKLQEAVKESSGLTGDELRSEINRRNAIVRENCARNNCEPCKCSACIPGIMNPMDNCYVCGSGPAPGAISWYPGFKELPIHEVNAAWRERMN